MPSPGRWSGLSIAPPHKVNFVQITPSKWLKCAVPPPYDAQASHRPPAE